MKRKRFTEEQIIGELFSWEALERRAYFDPRVLARYETQGSPVRVGESSKSTVFIRMIPAPRHSP